MTTQSGTIPPRQPGFSKGGDHWVMGKTREQLLAELKLYLERLREDPRAIADRLRVAAIQLRLGRVDEAMIHYEGVLGGYIAQEQLMSAMALCQRLLGHFPDNPKFKKIYKQVQATLGLDEMDDDAAEEITAEHLPPEHLDEIDFLDVLLQDDDDTLEEAGTARFLVSDVEPTKNLRVSRAEQGLPEEDDMEDEATAREVESSAPTNRWSPQDQPILLLDEKEVPLFPEESERLSPDYAEARPEEDEPVMLLTKKKVK